MTKIINGEGLFTRYQPGNTNWEAKARTLGGVFSSVVRSSWMESGAIFSLDYAEVIYHGSAVDTAALYLTVSSSSLDEKDTFELQFELDLSKDYTTASALDLIKSEVNYLLADLADDEWDNDEIVTGIES